MNKRVFGIPITKIIKAITVYIWFAITAYIAKYHIEGTMNWMMFTTVNSALLVIYAIPNKNWQEVFNNLNKHHN